MTLARIAGAWGLGLVSAAVVDERWYLVALPLIALAAFAVARGSVGLAEGVALPVAALLAGVLYALSTPGLSADAIAYYAGIPDVMVQGVIIDEPEVRAADLRFRFRPEGVVLGGSRSVVSGDLLVTTSRLTPYSVGDRLELEGKIGLPPNAGDFDYRAYLLRRGIVATMLFPRGERLGVDGIGWPQRGVFAARRSIAKRIEETFGAREAGLAQGVLTGRAPGLSPSAKEQLRATGLSHLVVVSGNNITLVGMLTASALGWLVGRRRALALGTAFAWAYAGLAGPSPPVFRAVVMVTLALVGLGIGRPGSAITALGLAALVMTALDPQLVHDVSFQLSFSAVAGVVFFGESLSRAIHRDEERGGMAEALASTTAMSFAAVIATLPVQLYHFERVSLVALPANLLVVPAFPLMVGAAATTAMTAAVSTDAAAFVAPVLALPFRWFAVVASSFSGIGGVTASGTAGAVAAVASFVVVAGGVWAARATNRRLGERRAAALTAFALPIAGIMAVALWWLVLRAPEPRTRVEILDVGRGQAVLIESREGQHVLVDGGEDGGRLLEQLDLALGSGVRGLDAVILTAGRSDRIAGLIDLVDRYEVPLLVVPPGDASTFTERWVRQSFEGAGTRIVEATEGQTLALSDGLVAVVGVSDGEGSPRGVSVVLWVAGVPFVVAGDAGATALMGLPAAAGGGLVASARQLSQPLLDATGPRMLLVAGQDDDAIDEVTPALVWRVVERGRITLSVGEGGVEVATDR